MESPAPVRSAQGVPGAMAAGSGSPSAFARSTIASVKPPPAEVPKIAMRRGSCSATSARQTAIASSRPAGNGWSGGIR